MGNTRDIDVLKHMVRYCKEIDEAVEQGVRSNELKSNPIYKNAVAMCILQIGELTSQLSDEFKTEYNQMPWQDIKGMRNVAAHRYGSIDMEMLWQTVDENIPELQQYCEEIILEFEGIQQERLKKDEHDHTQQMY